MINRKRTNGGENENTNALFWTAVVLWLVSLILSILVSGLTMYNIVLIETQMIQAIQLAAGNQSGLKVINNGTTVEIFNTGLHSLNEGPGIIVNNTISHHPVISLNSSYVKCLNSSELCMNTTTTTNITDFFNCTASCIVSGSCSCFNDTIIDQNITINNISNIVFNNVTIFSNESCCASFLHGSDYISITNNNGFINIINTGVINISNSTGIKNVGNQSYPILETDIIPGSGVSISGQNPLLFNNTGVLKIIQGANIIISSSNNDGTGKVNISLPFTINNINPGIGINITNMNNITVISNIGVIQNIPGIGINIDSSFGNGKGVVNISNTGVIQIFGGNYINITGTQQYPIVNYNPAILTALKGIFINSTGNAFNIGNIGVTKIINGTGITLNPSSGVGVVNISSDCLTNISAGNNTKITTSGYLKTISSSIVGGPGLTFSGTNPTTISASISPGSNIAFTGTNPVVMSVQSFLNLIPVEPVYNTIDSNFTGIGVNVQPFPIMRAILINDWSSAVPNCLIGYKASSTNYWSCPDQQNTLITGDPSTLYCPSQMYNYGEYWIPRDGWYLVSYNTQGSASFSGISLVVLNGTAGGCTRCSTGAGACNWSRIITTGGVFTNTGSSPYYLATHSAGVFYFTQNQVIGLLQTYTISYGTIYHNFLGGNSFSSTATTMTVQFLRTN